MAKKKQRSTGDSPLGVTLALVAGAAAMVGVMALPFLLAKPE